MGYSHVRFRFSICAEVGQLKIWWRLNSWCFSSSARLVVAVTVARNAIMQHRHAVLSLSCKEADWLHGNSSRQNDEHAKISTCALGDFRQITSSVFDSCCRIVRISRDRNSQLDTLTQHVWWPDSHVFCQPPQPRLECSPSPYWRCLFTRSPLYQRPTTTSWWPCHRWLRQTATGL